MTNNDNDVAGFIVTPTTGLTTNESGATANFTVALTSKPTRNVNIGLSSSNVNEGVPSTKLLIFTPTNWNAPQQVVVTGVDDSVVDGSIAYTIVTAAAISGDPRYNNQNPADVSVTNADNDASGITVTPVSGLITSEAGGSATFTVVLGSQPSANVVIGLSSSNTAEGTVSPASLTFTSANWNTPQRVTVKGVDDKIVDGNKAYTIVTAPAVSTDTRFNNLNPADVSVVNNDNDVAGITVNPVSGLITTEKAGTASFTIVLTSQPTAAVSIALSSSDTTEGTVSPASVTFTSANWSTAQRVTVTGVNDAFVDGNKKYTIVTAPATSTDPVYNTRNAADVSVENRDDEAINFSPASLNLNESVGNAVFTVLLGGSPETGYPVTVAYTTVDKTAFAGADFTAVSGSLTFAPGETSKTISVPITNDALGEDNETFNVKMTTATNGVLGSSALATGTILANDKVYFGSTTTTVNENVRNATITVKLNGVNTTQSTSVNYATANDTALAGSDYTTTSGTLTFAVGETTKTISVPIINDNLGEPNEQFKINLTAPVNGALGTPASTTVIITTNDPIMFSSNTYSVHENAGNAVFTLKLTGGALAQAVTVGFATSDGTALAGSDYTATTGTVTFNPGETTKTFTVPIREDTLAEPAENFRITLSNPTNGVLGNPNFTTVTILANDTIGFQYSTYTVVEYEPLGVVTVVLNAPSADTVTVNYATSNGTATAGSDYTAASGTLTFAPGETSKSFSVAIIDDSIAETSETINLTLSSATKAALGQATAVLTIVDNE